MNAPAPATAQKIALRWLSRIGAILVSAAIVYYFLHKVKWADLEGALERAELVPALLGGLVPLFGFWIADAAFTVKSFEWFDCPVRFRDYFVIKGGTYLLTLVNITFSAGGIFLYFMRKTGISVRRQTGLMGWRLYVAAVGAVAFLAAWMVGIKLLAPELAREFTAQAAAMVPTNLLAPELAQKLIAGIWLPLVLIAVFALVDPILFGWKGQGLVLKRLAADPASEVWSAFRMARPRHWLYGLAYTLPPIVINFLGMFLVARSFNIDVPFVYFMFWIPVALVVGALPIAFGQLGTTTAAWSFFFSAFAADPADIIAATLFIPTLRLIWRGAIGAAFMPFALRELEMVEEAKASNCLKPESEGPSEKP